jgi:hypothetical protein
MDLTTSALTIATKCASGFSEKVKIGFATDKVPFGSSAYEKDYCSLRAGHWVGARQAADLALEEHLTNVLNYGSRRVRSVGSRCDWA